MMAFEQLLGPTCPTLQALSQSDLVSGAFGRTTEAHTLNLGHHPPAAGALVDQLELGDAANTVSTMRLGGEVVSAKFSASGRNPAPASFSFSAMSRRSLVDRANRSRRVITTTSHWRI